MRYGRPRIILVYGVGLGDHLLCTAVFHELRKRGHRGLWMMSPHNGLFQGNGDIDAVVPDSWRYPDLVQRMGGRSYMPEYGQYDPAEDRSTPIDRHLITRMCQRLDITGEIDLRPYLFLSPQERRRGQLAPKQIAIQSSILSASLPIRNKEWFADRFGALVAELSGAFTFVQVGARTDPPVGAAIDLRGKTDLRQTAAILSQSVVFVGLVGFLMHLARAVDSRAVIVYGGRETPQLSGYPCNENLHTAMPCSPCWYWSRCVHERACMERIGPEPVIAAIHRQAAQFGTPLELARDDPALPLPPSRCDHD
ncbi:MAG: glycosyltransferase family 9 protein [Phycisphaeraceae bacterium]